MSRIALSATLGQSLGDGRYNTSGGGYASSSILIASAQSLQAAVDAAQAAAEANGTISGNGTALGLVQAIGTAFAAYVVAVTTAASKAAGANAIVDLDMAVLTTANARRAVMRELSRAVEGIS